MADLIGLVSLLKTSEGGRATTVYTGFAPVARLPAGGVAFALQFMSDDCLNAGESDAAMIEVARPEVCANLNTGDTFDLYDGPRLIGNVKILENTWRERQKIRVARLTALTPVLGVSDLDASVAFYQKLGFLINSQHESAGRRDRVHLKLADLELLLVADGAISNTAEHRAGRAAFTLAFRTDDPATLERTLTQAGLKLTPARNVPTAGRHFELHDPDGYRLLFGA